MSNRSKLSALAFARAHDWGADAFIAGNYIGGIVDRYTAHGIEIEEYIAVPATMTDVRAFGGY